MKKGYWSIAYIRELGFRSGMSGQGGYSPRLPAGERSQAWLEGFIEGSKERIRLAREGRESERNRV